MYFIRPYASMLLVSGFKLTFIKCPFSVTFAPKFFYEFLLLLADIQDLITRTNRKPWIYFCKTNHFDFCFCISPLC